MCAREKDRLNFCILCADISIFKMMLWNKLHIFFIAFLHSISLLLHLCPPKICSANGGNFFNLDVALLVYGIVWVAWCGKTRVTGRLGLCCGSSKAFLFKVCSYVFSVFTGCFIWLKYSKLYKQFIEIMNYNNFEKTFLFKNSKLFWVMLRKRARFKYIFHFYSFNESWAVI